MLRFFNIVSSSFLLLLLLLLTFLPNQVKAQEFIKTDYQVDYYLTESSQNLDTYVKFTISITNLRSDKYVKTFSLQFPRSFTIRNIIASDDKGTITPQSNTDEKKIKIDLEFQDPQIGRDAVNTMKLEFAQDNLFKINGNIWEVVLPTIENSSQGNYRIAVHLPPGTEKKISIAKPTPDEISNNTIYWINPKTRTIYAVFGDTQYYDLELAYHLKNTKIMPVYTDIALPPDTLYQKMYLRHISEVPSLLYQDEDGNYLARYFLKPKEIKTIIYSGTSETSSKPRDEMAIFSRANIMSQKKYLLNEEKYWKLSNLSPFVLLKTPQDIYRFVTDSLSYNYKRVTLNNQRLGAEKIISNRDQAVCVEFTDLFIAIAREKGIMAREHQGYGFSQDQELRPLSLTADVLHSWPEYYDEKSMLWTPVDPTWENTSGIDYFSSFDLNHITFAIHGSKSDYPYPAGMYKIENSQDIVIKPTQNKPSEKMSLTVEKFTIPEVMSDEPIVHTGQKLVVKNMGNVTLYNQLIYVSPSDILDIVPDSQYVGKEPYSIVLSSLSPFESKEIPLSYRPKYRTAKKNAIIKIQFNGKEIFEKKIRIISYMLDIALKAAYVLLAISIGFLLLRLWKKR